MLSGSPGRRWLLCAAVAAVAASVALGGGSGQPTVTAGAVPLVPAAGDARAAAGDSPPAGPSRGPSSGPPAPSAAPPAGPPVLPAPAPPPAPACPVPLDTWSVERLAAAVVTAPVQLSSLAGAEQLVRAGIGGILLIGPSPVPDLGARLAALRAASADGWPLLVMSDEEGGGVQRLGSMTERLPWARSMSSTGPAAIRARAQRVGGQLAGLGVTVDLAPVADLDAGPGPSAHRPAGRRSFSADPAVAGPDVAAFSTGLQAAGVGAVVKHFPGLGTATANTDMHPATTAPWSALTARDLQPFRDAVAAGARGVMTSHAVVPGLTDAPASLSPAVTAVLRRDLGFRGAIVTDSLSAAAIGEYGLDVPAAAVRALQAGADDVVFGSGDSANAYREAMAVRDAIVDAVRSGRLGADRLRDAARRDLGLAGLPC